MLLLGDFSLNSFCQETKSVLTFIGWALTIVKIAIPFIIIAYGIIDLGKAVTASKEDEIKTAAKRLLFRAIAGICIFFVPSVVLWLFGTVEEFHDATENSGGGFETCKSALLYPWDTGNDGTGTGN